jgi:hypothetical protein
MRSIDWAALPLWSQTKAALGQPFVAHRIAPIVQIDAEEEDDLEAYVGDVVCSLLFLTLQNSANMELQLAAEIEMGGGEEEDDEEVTMDRRASLGVQHAINFDEGVADDEFF